MPDFTYVVYRPLVTNMLMPAMARDLTVTAMEVQGRFALGRSLFRLLANARPPKQLRTHVMGLSFASPIGVGAHVDLEGAALRLWPALGAGFTIVGPVRSGSELGGDGPRLINELCSIVTAPEGASTRTDVVRSNLSDELGRKEPVGLHLDGPDIPQLLQALARCADFFSLPLPRDEAEAASWVASADCPVLVRVDASLDAGSWPALQAALDGGAKGFVLADGVPTDLVPNGRLHGPYQRDAALAAVRGLRAHFGPEPVILGAGGIMTPEDGAAFVHAGANLVSLFEGMVYAGPGLPRRTNRCLVDGPRAYLEQPAPATKKTSGLRTETAPSHSAELRHPQSVDYVGAARIGAALLIGLGATFLCTSLGLLGLAATVVALPQELASVGMSLDELSLAAPGPLVPFMAHNRVCLSGAMGVLGAFYLWVATNPLRNREAWAWWSTLLSGLGATVMLFVALRSNQVYDVWLATIQAVLLTVHAAAMALTFSHLKKGERGIRSIMVPGASAWLWSPAGRGRLLAQVWGLGLLVGGAMVVSVGVTSGLVPEDVCYLGFGGEELNRIHPGLLGVVTRDRIGFGTTLFAAGVIAVPALWCGLSPGRSSLLTTFTFSAVWLMVTAVGVHPIIGYVDLWHLTPFLIMWFGFISSRLLLARPLARRGGGVQHFPDLWVHVDRTPEPVATAG